MTGLPRNDKYGDQGHEYIRLALCPRLRGWDMRSGMVLTLRLRHVRLDMADGPPIVGDRLASCRLTAL